MEERHFEKIQQWFEQLSEKVELCATKQQLENRFSALLTVCTNTRNDVNALKEDMESVQNEIYSFKRLPH